MKKFTNFISKFYMVLLFVFFYLPIVVTVIFSFNSSKSLTHFTGFSLRWYQELLSNSEVMSAVYVSVTIALLATVISTVLGTLTALGLSRSRKFIKQYLLNVNNIPILSPEIVIAISLMLMFSSIGMPKGYWTMLLAHISFCTPFVITNVYPKVRSLDPNLANAAMDLGATPYQALTKVIVPIIRPGIFAGALMAFTMSFDDFVISYFVSGNGVKNISIVVYNMTKRINPTINALSTIVIVVIVAILLFVNVMPMIRKRKGINDTSYSHLKHKKRRFLGSAIAVILIFAIVAGTSAASKGGKQTLHIYNAGEYMNLDLIAQFEEEYGCTVMYETFESNEMMYTKLSAGDTYDLIIPSDYMIERLIKEEWIQPIQWELISNKDNLLEEVLDHSFDPGNVYSVPYFWGSVGILYDKTIVDEADLEAQGWNVLMNEKYKGNLYMYDSERDSFMVALKALGYSMNTKDEGEIREAYDWLMKQRDTMEPVYAGDDVIDNMVSGNKALAIVYSGDAAYIMTENENMGYFTPEEGTNIWYDGMVITKNCKNVGLAHEFIDFMLQNDVALANTDYVGYSSSVASAFEEMQSTTYEGINAYVPNTDNPNDEIFGYQDMNIKKLFAELWTKVKAN